MREHSHHTAHDMTTAPGYPEAGAPANQRHAADSSGDAVVTRAREELGAAATHGHRALAHEEPTAHDAHDAHGGASVHGGAHTGHDATMFARPFWVSLILTIPVVAYAEHIQMLLGYAAPTFLGSRWLEPMLASVIYWYGGWVFLTGAVAELRSRRPGMMTLVALAITAAYGYSLAVTFGVVAGVPFYWELATLVTIMLLGHWLELRAVGGAQSALGELARLLPDTAERVVAGGTARVPVAALAAGDLVLVRPGGRVPADGTVEDSRGPVDESMITGESRPVEKVPGAAVVAGTIGGGGSLRVRVSRIGDETALAGIMRLVAEAQTSRTRAQALADRAASWLTLVAIGAAALALIGWSLARGFDSYTLERVVTTLVVACPHALGLAIPLVVAISTTLSARHGILVRDRLALEWARKLDVVVFDKTGTLTRGEQGLVDLAVADGDERAALGLAAAIEGDSEHPIARAIVAAARERGVAIPPTTAFAGLPGRGVRATVAGRVLQVGGPHLLERGGVAPPGALRDRARAWGEHGQTVVYLLEGEGALAAFALADVIRPESRQAVATLRARC